MAGSAPGIHRLAVLTSAATFSGHLHPLVPGRARHSTGSGLAVPDWPLSFGRFFPPMVGGVLFEHGHRVAATDPNQQVISRRHASDLSRWPAEFRP
jgi:heme A synthase